jgi:hypothetical protein
MPLQPIRIPAKITDFPIVKEDGILPGAFQDILNPHTSQDPRKIVVNIHISGHSLASSDRKEDSGLVHNQIASLRFIERKLLNSSLQCVVRDLLRLKDDYQRLWAQDRKEADPLLISWLRGGL